MGEYGSCSLGVRQTGAISNAPNVGILVVAEGVLVAIQKSSSVGEAGLFDVFMCAHRRNHMQEVEFASDELLAVQILEGGLVAAHPHQRVLESSPDVVSRGYFREGLGVFGNAEHHRIRLEELHLNGKVLLLPFVSPKV